MENINTVLFPGVLKLICKKCCFASLESPYGSTETLIIKCLLNQIK